MVSSSVSSSTWMVSHASDRCCKPYLKNKKKKEKGSWGHRYSWSTCKNRTAIMREALRDLLIALQDSYKV